MFSNCSNCLLIIDYSRRLKYFQNYLKCAFKVIIQTENCTFFYIKEDNLKGESCN